MLKPALNKIVEKIEFKAFKFLLKKFIFTRLVRRFLLFIGFIIVLLSFLFFIFKPKVPKHINYGVNFSNKYAEELGLNWQDAYLEILDDLNVKNIRLVAYWDEIEPANNQYDYSKIRWQLDEAKKRDVKVILAIGKKVPRYPECHTPSWWSSLTDTQKTKELHEYLATTVNTFKDYPNITTWQVENEPFFPFGECDKVTLQELKEEVSLVRNLDSSRPILIQDSGEGGLWFPSYKFADYLGISMYRRIWYNFWNVLLGKFIYFKYPLAHWTYRIKALAVGIPYQKIIVTELQAEPWGPGSNAILSQEEKDKTMSKHQFLTTITYAQKAGFSN
ncbi:MAG TPA: hypothetical protein ENJ78_01355, partial [candidate division WWE3 bacterium]|nr:hypothetical protein [candidate division WWE3 bacterium]